MHNRDPNGEDATIRIAPELIAVRRKPVQHDTLHIFNFPVKPTHLTNSYVGMDPMRAASIFH